MILFPIALLVSALGLVWAFHPRHVHDWGIADMGYYAEDETVVEQCRTCGRRR